MKDPAVLFYTADFIAGTITMTDEQRGQYILLLCLQHQKGVLTEKDMLKICNSYDEDIWSKFTFENGLYFNERMKTEANKRRKYSESRAKNRKKKDSDEEDKKDMKNISNSYDKHMVNENEDINKDISKELNTVKVIKEGGNNMRIPPTIKEVTEYCNERNNGVNVNKWHSHYEAKGWMIGKNKMKDWKAAVRTWEEDKPPAPPISDFARQRRVSYKDMEV